MLNSLLELYDFQPFCFTDTYIPTNVSSMMNEINIRINDCIGAMNVPMIVMSVVKKLFMFMFSQQTAYTSYVCNKVL